MDFESPDVEREFPGLYASESGSGKRSQESDFSDDAHDRSIKKELLIGKRKDKKESKKDQGYAALEGESSPEEDVDVKSPCKSKKSKSFKFPTIKEKREKSREKDVKEKDRDKEKERDKERDGDRDKEKKKEFKSKLKLKDKKKAKSSEDPTESVEEMPVFGVPLSVAVDRSHCHDSVGIPVVIRDCIDYVQDFGLTVESIYKVSGIKSKVQQIRRCYNKREPVRLQDYDTPTVTSLLKTFLRELPESIFTNDLSSRFEEVASIKELAARERELSSLLAQIPQCNLLCLSWIMRHLESVAANECQNKMGATALGAVFGPVLQTSSRVVTALLSHSSVLFSNVKLVRYVPPLSSGCTSLPSTREGITAELAKQDSLLNQIHSEMNHGYTVRSDQLWEVQRFITLLKRKLRTLEKAQEACSQVAEKVVEPSPAAAVTAATAVSIVSAASAGPSTSASKETPVSPSVDTIDFQLQIATEESGAKAGSGSEAEEKENTVEAATNQNPASKDETDAEPQVSSVAEPLTQESSAAAPLTPVSDQSDHKSSSELEEWGHELPLELEHIELMKLQNFLISRISNERERLEELRTDFKSLTCAEPDSSAHNSTSTNNDVKAPLENAETSLDQANVDKEESREAMELYEENENLMHRRLNLVRQIMYEREACISLRIQVDQLKQSIEAK